MQESLNKILKSDLLKDYSFSVPYTDEEGVTSTFTVFTNAQFRQIIKQMFGSRQYNDWDDESVLSSLVSDFQTSFDTWKAIRQDTYGRRMYALSLKFNPLENYRSHEEREGSFEHGESITLSFTDRKDTTKDDSFIERTHTNLKETTKDDTNTVRTYGNGYKETYGHGEQTHTHALSADDSSTYAPQYQDIDGTFDDTKEIEGTITDQKGWTSNGLTKETSGSYKDQKGQLQNGLTFEKAGSETTEHSGTDTDGYTIEKYGNIGVTTSKQMLASDLDLLKYDITMCAIREFIGQYTFISCEVD